MFFPSTSYKEYREKIDKIHKEILSLHEKLDSLFMKVDRLEGSIYRAYSDSRDYSISEFKDRIDYLEERINKNIYQNQELIERVLKSIKSN